jgi:death-associated protein kinase
LYYCFNFVLSHTSCFRITSAGSNDLAELKEFGRLAKLGLARIDRPRLYLCGDTTVGKTTLAQSLNYGQLPPHAASGKSTQGISVFTADLAPSRSNQSDVQALFSVWDFAGQTDYHVSHSLFVEPKIAVFLVLCDLTKGVAAVEEQARYWLHRKSAVL